MAIEAKNLTPTRKQYDHGTTSSITNFNSRTEGEICSTRHLISINHDLNCAHRGSQKELMRVEIATKTSLWNYLCYLQFSAARIKLNLKRYPKHSHKFLNNYQRQNT
jgi:hypothetical protein